MLTEDSSARHAYLKQLRGAMAAAERIHGTRALKHYATKQPDRFDMWNNRLVHVGRLVTRGWRRAVNRHYISAIAEVDVEPQCKQPFAQYRLRFEAKAMDSYDGNPGGRGWHSKLYRLHVTGLGRNYYLWGQYSTEMTWNKYTRKEASQKAIAELEQ